MRTAVIALLALLVLATPSLARHITFDDLYGLPRCTGPAVSPDGKRIVFVLHTSDPKANDRQSHLWIMDADGSNQRQLTFGASGEYSPCWTPDGQSILFVAHRGDGNTQVWQLPLSGGEAHQASFLTCGVSEFMCAPGGEELLLVSRVYPDCASDTCNARRLEYDRDNPNRPRLFTKLPVRLYSHYNDGRINRLYRARIADSASTREVLTSPYSIPTAMQGGFRDFDIAPGGAELCFSMSRDSMPVLGVNSDLFLLKQGVSSPARITTNPGLDHDPRFSPDGRCIAYEAATRFGYESDQADIMIYDRKDQTHRNITADFDNYAGELMWGPKSKYIYFSSIEHGMSKIYRVDVNAAKVDSILGDAAYEDLGISPDGKFLICTRSVSNEPSELWRYDLGTKKLTRLTHFTDDITSELTMHRATDFWFPGFNGDSIHGLLTKPPDFDPSKKYPLVLLIHGGPQWCWLGDFNYYGWNTQLTAAQGYVVAQIDPHGSSGYGLKFKEHVSGNWGRGDFEDLMMGVDYLLENNTFIDSTRMAALGRSYGGFMINWICGHTDRFQCLIGIDGTYNHVSFYGSTDELWFPEWDIAGTPWSNPDEYKRSSPLSYAENFKTPTMLIHGQHDYRVDLSEGLQMFTALQRMGVPSQILIFPNEGHSVGRLDNLRTVYDEQYKWLTHWLK